VASLLLGAASLLVLGGCAAAGPVDKDVGWVEPGPTASSPVTGVDPTSAPSPGLPVTEVPRASASLEDRPPDTSVTPTRVLVPSLDIDVAISPEGIDADGALALPEDPEVASWYRFGPSPSSPEGTTVVAAHVDSVRYGIGPFSRLASAPTGTTVTVLGEDGQGVDYVVDRVELAPKAGIDWSRVFDREGPPRLALVTCGGDFDAGTGHYVSNVIVSAVRS